jgi:hypothetical protein
MRGKVLGEAEMTPEKPFFNGAWILGAGKNTHIRKELLRHVDWAAVGGLPWSSFLVPWAHPSMFAPEAIGVPRRSGASRAAALERVRTFFRIAAVLDDAPEGHDCAVGTWTHIAGFESRLVATKPHLERVVANLARVTRECRPPDALCATVMHLAESFCDANRESARYWTANEVLCACEVQDYDHEDMVQKLHAECCFATLESIQKFNEANEAKVKRVFVFREGATVSWLDISFSQKKIWAKAKLCSEMLLVRTSREYFIVATGDALAGAGAPTIYAHPLTALRTKAHLAHPLWSARQELLEACL